MGLFNKLNQKIGTKHLKEDAVVDNALVNEVIFGSLVEDTNDLLDSVNEDAADLTRIRLQQQKQKASEQFQKRQEQEKEKFEKRKAQIDKRLDALRAQKATEDLQSREAAASAGTGTM